MFSLSSGRFDPRLSIRLTFDPCFKHWIGAVHRAMLTLNVLTLVPSTGAEDHDWPLM